MVQELEMLVEGAYDHLPDRVGLYENKQLYDEVVSAIKDYKDNYNSVKVSTAKGLKYEDREITLRGILQIALRNFLDIGEERPDQYSNSGVYTIVSHPDANPNR